jgi:sodium/potassium-transporting ATPase subunit alpha
MIFYSTNCVAGDAKGVVVRTGDDTVMGCVAGLASKLEHEASPIRIELNNFVVVITYVALAIGELVWRN